MRYKVNKDWKERADNNTKLVLMRSFKDEPRESKLMESNNRSAAKILCRIRSGSHELRIDSGRNERIPRDQRKCRLCDEEVEDEIHFLGRCSLFRIDRKKLEDEFGRLTSNLVIGEDEDSIEKVLKYVKKIFKQRSRILKDIVAQDI